MASPGPKLLERQQGTSYPRPSKERDRTELAYFYWYTNVNGVNTLVIRIYLIRTSRLKFAEFYEYCKYEPEVEISIRVYKIMCVETDL